MAWFSSDDFLFPLVFLSSLSSCLGKARCLVWLLCLEMNLLGWWINCILFLPVTSGWGSTRRWKRRLQKRFFWPRAAFLISKLEGCSKPTCPWHWQELSLSHTWGSSGPPGLGIWMSLSSVSWQRGQGSLLSTASLTAGGSSKGEAGPCVSDWRLDLEYNIKPHAATFPCGKVGSLTSRLPCSTQPLPPGSWLSNLSC